MNATLHEKEESILGRKLQQRRGDGDNDDDDGGLAPRVAQAGGQCELHPPVSPLTQCAGPCHSLCVVSRQ